MTDGKNLGIIGCIDRRRNGVGSFVVQGHLTVRSSLGRPPHLHVRLLADHRALDEYPPHGRYSTATTRADLWHRMAARVDANQDLVVLRRR